MHNYRIRKIDDRNIAVETQRGTKNGKERWDTVGYWPASKPELAARKLLALCTPDYTLDGDVVAALEQLDMTMKQATIDVVSALGA